MGNIKKNGITNLTKKATSIFGAALAALTGMEANATIMSTQIDNLDSKIVSVSEIGKVKPMPVLKLNPNNPENSIFVASHGSHSSHASHGSHGSHRSGGMFA